ncbi:MAG: DUF4142 domain-containing protein [Pseudomonadota bacterium]|nr:DUF4142 domain-containing protein [Pseudomonadota bacterium]
MKRTLLISGAFAALLAVAACGEKNEVVEDGPVENASAESGVGSNPVSNMAQDAAGAAVGAASAVTLGRTTEGFVTNAAISDMYEIAAGKLALEKSKNAEVKKLAQQIISDHEKTMAEMKTAMGSAGADVTAPTAMDERRQGMVDNLRQAAPDQFDQVYIGQQVAAHNEAVTLHRTYADNGDNAALKQLAAKHLPALQNHLQMAQAMENKMGGGQGGKQGGGSQ